MEILKLLAIPPLVLFVVFSTKQLVDNFDNWFYERQNKEYLKMIEECKKEQKKRKQKND